MSQNIFKVSKKHKKRAKELFKLHKELWDNLAKHPTISYFGKTLLVGKSQFVSSEIHNHCYPCQFSEELFSNGLSRACNESCLVQWNAASCLDEGSYYQRWYKSRSYQSKSYFARLIRDLPLNPIYK